jgi:hypothetical protein
VEKSVEIPIQAVAETRVAYIERAADERAQVKIDTPAPQVVARVNGRDFTFDSVSGEKHAFEKGQLVVRQESAASLALAAWSGIRVSALQAELGRLRSDVKMLDVQHNLTKAELFLRTDLSYVDESIRGYYEKLIKESLDAAPGHPDSAAFVHPWTAQARGVDGRFPRER